MDTLKLIIDAKTMLCILKQSMESKYPNCQIDTISVQSHNKQFLRAEYSNTEVNLMTDELHHRIDIR